MKERLLEFLAYLNISQKKFEENVGLSNGFVDKVGDSIRTNNLNKISAIYPDLNLNWLKTGEGEMLKQENTNIGHTTFGNHSPIRGNIEIDKCRSELEMAQMKIQYLEEIIKSKDETINALKKNV